MSKGVLRSKAPLKFSGTGAPKRACKEEYESMMEKREGQNQPTMCGAVPDGPNMWKCDGDCPYDEGQGMFPSCLPFDYEDEFGYVYWCQCAFATWQP